MDCVSGDGDAKVIATTMCLQVIGALCRRFKGNERCDCTKSFVAEENIENRYYYSPQHNITVTFFLKYGAATIKGRYFADGGPPSHLTNLTYHELGQRVHDWEFHHGDLAPN